MTARLGLAIHGGSGTISRDSLGERYRPYRQALEDVLEAAWGSLQKGARAVEAVEQGVCLLEQCEYFNAGRGSVLTSQGEVEMDAAIMDGRARQYGAVAVVKTPRHPVSLARAVMAHPDHVLLVGAGADHFAASVGLAQEQAAYFISEERRHQLQTAAIEGSVSLDHDDHYGTVGAVARDRFGDLAAATSTGGMTNQTPGRVGDSPIIGCGTWADNRTCAVSATGHGEHLLRTVIAHDIHARMLYGKASLRDAAAGSLTLLAELDGRGGVIAVDASGQAVTLFNTQGMYRGWIDSEGQAWVAIDGDEACA